MKKNKFLIFALLVLIFSGCYNNDSDTDYAFTKYEYVNEINDNVRISIPQIANDNFDDVNELIKTTIVDYILNYYSNDLDDLTLELSYEISYDSKDLISINFSGVGNKKNAAYPNNIFKTINIDMRKRKLLKLNDLYNVDYSFIEMYKKEFEKQVEGISINDIYTDEQLANYFKNADEFDSYVMSYYTKDKIGISLLVPHAIGDHIEVEILKKKSI